MSHFMRKHKKSFLWALAILVVPTFILWGGYRGSGRSGESHENPDAVVAKVGGTPVSVQQYRRALDAEVQQRQRSGQTVTYKDLAQDGTADKVLNDLITGVLYSQAVQEEPVRIARDYLVEKLKQDPEFKDEKGAFDVAKWNQFIEESKGMDWNAQYAQLEDATRRQLLAQQVFASARVLDKDVRTQFEADHTTLGVKYAVIEPKIEPTDDQIQAFFDAHKADYSLPEERTAEFAAISIQPPPPAVLADIVKQARAGADFAELAKKYSETPDKDKGGEMDWKAEKLAMPPQEEALFKLQPGEVSDPIEAPGAYLVYKVEDARTNETTQQREVKARRIVIRPGKLDDADQTARKGKADEIVRQAKASKDLAAAAAAAGLPVQKTSSFSIQSMSIDAVPAEDARAFRSGVSTLGEGEVSEVIAGSRNLYVAKVLSVTQAVPQPLDAVREKVKEDLIADTRRSPEYMAKVEKLVADIQAKAHSLQDIQTLFPEVPVEVKEMKEFSAKNFDYSSGVFWNPREIYEALGTKEPGAFAGPIRDMLGKVYFVELVSKTLPDDAASKDDFAKEEKDIRKNLLMAKKQQRLSDFLQDLQDSATARTPIEKNTQLIFDLLGMSDTQKGSDASKSGEEPVSTEKTETAGGETAPVSATAPSAATPEATPPASAQK